MQIIHKHKQWVKIFLLNICTVSSSKASEFWTYIVRLNFVSFSGQFAYWPYAAIFQVISLKACFELYGRWRKHTCSSWFHRPRREKSRCFVQNLRFLSKPLVVFAKAEQLSRIRLLTPFGFNWLSITSIFKRQVFSCVPVIPSSLATLPCVAPGSYNRSTAAAL